MFVFNTIYSKQIAATAYDGLSLNYRVIFVTDAARGVDVNDIADQKKILTNHGALMATAKQVKFNLRIIESF